MKSFSRRRSFCLILLILATGAFVVAHQRWGASVHRAVFLYGWALFAVMVLLTVFNARKKLPFLPLGTAEGWLQLHIYAGFFSVVLFLFHIRFRYPTGWFELILAWLFALVTVSGIVGLLFSRVFPRRMATRGGEVLFDRIPALRRALQEQVEAVAVGAIAETRSATITDFYARDLKEFFDRPPSRWMHWMEVRRPLTTLLNKMDDLNRFLGDQERVTMAKVADLVRQKDCLDYQYSLQWMLRAWLFVHVPLTYSLMLFSLVHVVLVYAFAAGTP
jgi:hypothetical protein